MLSIPCIILQFPQFQPPNAHNCHLFYVHVAVHHKSMYLEDQSDAVLSSLYLLYCQVTLQVSGVSRTHHQGTQTVLTTTGTSHEFENVVIKSV
jgi:hypothetical protein